MGGYDDVITGRDALHRLDTLTAGARDEFDSAMRAADGFARRRADLARLKADGYRELAAMRLDVIKAGVGERLSEAEKEAARLVADHEKFLTDVDALLAKAADALSQAEVRRRTGEEEVDAALRAYEALAAETENELQDDPAYLEIKRAYEEAKAVAERAAQKLELARADRQDKSAPYESDLLFSYLWKRKFRTPDYRFGGLTRMLDNWVAKLCRYDEAYLNYARLTELPDRIAEHLASMNQEAEEAKAAIERYEEARLEARGAGKLSADLEAAKSRLKDLDAGLSAAEAKHAELRVAKEKAASGDAGPQEQARRVIEDELAKVSFPNLKVLAAQTTTLDDDRIVEALIKLRTEELQMEVNWRNVEALPARRRAGAETLERVRRRFKEAGLDSPYVLVLRGAFEAALEAYGRGPSPDGEKLWKAITATIRQAPREDDDYFGGHRRGRSVGIPGVVTGVVLGEVLRGLGRGRRWGGGGWGGGSSGGGGGGFKTGGRIGGGGGFKTGGKF